MIDYAQPGEPTLLPRQQTSWHESLALGLVVFVSASMALGTRPPGHLASLWVTNALLLGLMLRRPSLSHGRCWATAAPALVTAEWLAGGPLPQALWLTCADLCAVACGWRLLRRLPQRVLRMHSPSSVLHLVLCSLLVSLVGALLGSLGLQHLLQRPWPATAAIWFSSELMHMTLILPVLLSFPQRSEMRHWRRPPGGRPVEHLLPLLALIASETVALYIGGPGALSLTMPAMLLCAMRYDLFIVSLLNLLSCAIKLAAFSEVSFTPDSTGMENMFSFRLGLATLSIGPLAVACTLSAFKDMLSKLRHAVSHDALTGLLSRASFMEHAQRALERQIRQQAAVAMLMLDLDHFKCINDRHGHAAGDRVLQEVTARLAQALRPHELIGRLGGEEFAVLLPGADRASACAVAQRLCDATSGICIELDPGSLLRPTLSIGIGWVATAQPQHGLSGLLRTADMALYHAKNGGRNRFHIDGDQTPCPSPASTPPRQGAAGDAQPVPAGRPPS